ncbi:spore coat protein GerQ [Sporosarcina sp. HYO08]|uniref:spore coat protein GerQ n=1 Tax=Sporosarcina sp. HYO08 TaxID=1759557 RepID=UPI0007911E6C|nr:spore coat protein GerQ [Sporosarcina sp. HYO08]KXH83926.1 spore coat protein GerQ [Sporosarcina sp. HYO08]
MVQYYWNPNLQNQHITPPAVTIPSGRPPSPGVPIGGTPAPMPGIPFGAPYAPPAREQSYIENILRLNIGNPGTFHFSFEHALRSGINTLAVKGVVEAAGRDHAIIKESDTGRTYLFPMIYFDFAEFEGDVEYFNQQP